NGQLVGEITVERLEVGRQRDCRVAFPVCDGVAIVDVHHIGRFDTRMRECLVGWVEWVIDREEAEAFRDRASDTHVSSKIAGEACGTFAKDARATAKVQAGDT